MIERNRVRMQQYPSHFRQAEMGKGSRDCTHSKRRESLGMKRI